MKKMSLCRENIILVYNWLVELLQIIKPIPHPKFINITHNMKSVLTPLLLLLSICYSLLSFPTVYLFISRVPPWALNTVELTHSGPPDRKQLVSVRLNSLRPKAARAALRLSLLKEAIWSCSCAHHKLSPIMTGPLTTQAGPVCDGSQRSTCWNAGRWQPRFKHSKLLRAAT